MSWVQGSIKDSSEIGTIHNTIMYNMAEWGPKIMQAIEIHQKFLQESSQ